MTYKGSLMARIYRLDSLLLVATKNKDQGLIELIQGYLDDALAELTQAEYMEGNYVPEANAV